MVDACFQPVDRRQATCCVEAIDGALSRESGAALVVCAPWLIVCRCGRPQRQTIRHGRRWVVRVTAQAEDARESLAALEGGQGR